MRSSSANALPIVDGLFTWPSNSPKLIGTRCISCGTYYFPKKISCNNPSCKEKRVEEVLLSTSGKLYSYTIQYYPPPAPFKFNEPFIPYGIGLIELPEEIRVAGILTTNNIKELKVGMKCELVIEKLYTDDKRNDFVTYKFRPIN